MELGSVIHAALRVGAPDSRTSAQRIALSSSMLMPLLASQGSSLAGMTELARDLRAEIAARGERGMALVLPAGAAHESQPARIDVGGRQIAIPGDLRDVLLARLGIAETAPGPARPAVLEDSASRAWATGASAQVAAQSAQPASTLSAAQLAAQSALTASVGGFTRELLRSIIPAVAAAARDPAGPPRLELGAAALGEPAGPVQVGPVLPVAEVAARLRREVERSGLFFESHLAQWARGERSVDEMRAELLHLAADGSFASGKTGAQVILDGAPQRVAGQLRLLEDPCIAINGAAWPGQPMQMLIEREPPPRGAAPGLPTVFGAHLRLVLPRLGSIEVHLRLAGEAVATTICAQSPDRLEAGLAGLGEQLRATGLTPVSTHLVAAEVEPA
jgi:hypothetical protein